MNQSITSMQWNASSKVLFIRDVLIFSVLRLLIVIQLKEMSPTT